MSDGILSVLEQQPDISKIKPISSNDEAIVFKVKQTLDKGSRKQFVRVLKDVRSHQAVKREKDILHYLNQFPEFIHFNEIRKVGYHYLQFFDFKSKKSLQQTIDKKGAFSAKAAKKLLTDMVAVLEHVHTLGFVHGDITPNNILLGKKQAYLVEWSHAIPSLGSYESELILGDKLYCSPERLNGRLDEASDIYSLGCTLYFALTGKHIYRLAKGESEANKLWAHTHHSVHKMNKLPIFWRYLIFWMTQKTPEKRPDLVELKKWLKDQTVPEWVRKMSVRVDKSYPADPMTVLADEHFMYPIFKKAQASEKAGDLETAFNLYENCAFRDYSLAETSLGLMYEQGKPIKQSYAMAANMYHQAFQKGNPDAAYKLGHLFEEGLGMPVNLDYAVKLYRFAALRGNLRAQNALGMMYFQGQGVAQDMAQAHTWLGLAAEYGNEEAQTNLKMLLQKSKAIA